MNSSSRKSICWRHERCGPRRMALVSLVEDHGFEDSLTGAPWVLMFLRRRAAGWSKLSAAKSPRCRRCLTKFFQPRRDNRETSRAIYLPNSEERFGTGFFFLLGGPSVEGGGVVANVTGLEGRDVGGTVVDGNGENR
jgi:hypothetical protein